MFWRADISPEAGPYKVLLKKGELNDPARGRNVPFKIYYPDSQEGEKFPVILWSHGFGGNRDGAAFLSRYIAAHGYIIVHMTHAGTDSSLWEGRPEHPWDILRKAEVGRETTLARFADVPFMLDRLEAADEAFGDLPNIMDLSSIGMSGHSFGALTTQVMAGQKFPGEDNTLINLKDGRFKAGIVYSPVPVPHLTDAPPEDVYGPVSMPLLHMTGTEDESPLEGFGYDRRLLVYNYTEYPEKFLLVKEGGDHMVYNGTRGKLQDNPLRERHEEIIKIASLAFWDAYLKGDKKALAWLTEDGFAHYIGADGQFESHME